MASLFDTTLARVGGKEWKNDSLAVPQCGMVKAEDLEEPITLHQFLEGAGRRPDEAKVTTLLFDVHTYVLHTHWRASAAL